MNSKEPSKNIIEKIISIFNKKNYLEALNLSNKILEEYPNSVLINNITGVIQTEINNYDEAKKLFIRVVSLNPKYSDGFYNLANIYKKLDQDEKAIETYNKVIQLDNSYFKAYNNLGNLYREKI